jgi:hypothetical protein
MSGKIRSAAPAAAALASVALAVVFLSGCAGPSGEDRVSELRSQYEARLNSFTVRQTPVVVETTVVPEGAEPGGEATTEATGVEPFDVPVRQDAYLDIMVSSDADEKLPGITVDIDQLDGEKNPKAAYKVWLDTSSLPRGSSKAVTHVLEDIQYTEGDAFSVEIRSSVPPEERADYREYAESAGEPS